MSVKEHLMKAAEVSLGPGEKGGLPHRDSKEDTRLRMAPLLDLAAGGDQSMGLDVEKRAAGGFDIGEEKSAMPRVWGRVSPLPVPDPTPGAVWREGGGREV